MKIISNSVVGSVESNDILVKVSPGTGININLESSVIKQYGDDIRKTIVSVIDELGVNDLTLDANDKGALDFTIKARVKTAIKNASK